MMRRYLNGCLKASVTKLSALIGSKAAIVITAVVLFSSSVYGQGHETFDTYPHNSSSYSRNIPEWTGVNGIKWNITTGAKGKSIEGTTPLIGNNKSPKGGELYSSAISGGIGNLKFKYRKAFSSNTKISVYINDNLIDELNVNSSTVKEFSKDINVDGDFVIKFVTTERTLLDEVIWTKFGDSGTGTTGTITGTAPAEGVKFDYVKPPLQSASQQYNLTFADLENDITVTATDDFQISTDDTDWKTSFTIAKDATSPKTLYVRYAPTSDKIMGASGTITHAAVGTSTYSVKLFAKGSSDITDATTLPMDETLDVVTWNVEWFGAPEKSKHADNFDEQLDAVSAKIISLDADVYALQELVVDNFKGDNLAPLVAKLNELSGADVWGGTYGPRYSHDDTPSADFPAQRLCYVYNKSTVTNIKDFSMFSDLYPNTSTTNIPGYTGNAAKFMASGRLPYMFEADINIDGATERICIVNIHGKCCRDGADRRRADAKFLLNALNADYPENNVIILGDYNDYKDRSMAGGDSPYKVFWEEDNKYYKHVAGEKIDHISVSNELYEEHALLTNSVSVSNVYISDHDPIMLRLKYESFSSVINITEKNMVFDYVEVVDLNSVSDTKEYTLKGETLTGDVSVAVTEPFQISLDGADWKRNITIPQADAANVKVKVRFKPTVKYTDKITGEIVHTSPEARTVKISLAAQGEPDVTAPTFASGFPAVDNVYSSSFNLKVKIDEPGKAYYYVIDNDGTAPDVAAIKSGTGAVVFGKFATGTDETSKEVTGLTQDTDYDLYVIAEDNYEFGVNTMTTPVKFDIHTTTHVMLPYEYVKTVTQGQHYASTGIPATYYSTATGLKGDALKAEIKSIINQNYVSYPYEEDGRGDVPIESRRMVAGATPLDVYDIMDEADQNPNNPDQVYMVYKEVVYNKDAKHLGLKGSQEKWNREHVYPQSVGKFKNARAPWGDGPYANGTIITNAGTELAFAQSDAHHLRSSDKMENAKRNNYPFVGSRGGYTPPLSARGDVARIVFYLNVRYGLQISKVGNLNMLLQWCEQDPVDPYEVRRNNIVFKYQKNRNPFVDYPELAQHIFGDKTNEEWNGTGPKAQTITFDNVATKTYGDDPFTINATSTSALPVTYTFVSGPATLNGKEVTITGAGTIVIKATQAGNDDFLAAAPVDLTVVVNKANQVINYTAIGDKTYGDDPFDIVATTASGLDISYVLKEGAATLAGNKVTITGAGDIKITASQAGNENYNKADDVDITIAVYKAEQAITFKEIPAHKLGSGDITLEATSDRGLDVTFAIESGKAELNGKVLKPLEIGNIVVVASQAGNENVNAAYPVKRTVVVTKATDINDMLQRSIKLYPNPVNSILKIDSKQDIVKVDIVNISGATIKSFNRSANRTEIDFSDIDSGVYMVKIYTSKGVVTKQIVKE
jgi:endonuclease/exonuclease/phosphatase family metal-dependent hydrolase